MYKKIMVPLDGSALAERALPLAVALANNLKAALLLVRVADHNISANETVDKELKHLQEAEEYLRAVYVTLTDSTLTPHLEPERLETLALYGPTDREIAEVAPLEKVDLIIMSTHGRTGLARFILGSVATGVLQHTALPVMLIKPDHIRDARSLVEFLTEPSPFSPPAQEGGGNEWSDHDYHEPGRVVVTLDGTPEAEVALDHAVEIARQLKTGLDLLQVVMTMMPVEYGAITQSYAARSNKDTHRQQLQAEEYLSSIQARLAEQGIVCQKAVRLGDPAREIITYAQQTGTALLVMATHARGKVGRFIMGSVAEEVLRGSHLPVMMVHPLSYARVASPVRASLAETYK